MSVSTAPRANPSSRSRRLASTALLLGASFAASRILGLVRTVAIGAVFVDSRQVEAYFAAFRIPDTIFMLVSGGALSSAFIPVFAGLLETRKEEDAWRVASTVLNTVCLALAGLAVIGFILAPLIMGVLTGGFAPGEENLTVHLTRIMLLQPIFLGASALISGALQSYHRFVLTAIAPLVYNVVLVAGVLLTHFYGVDSLAWSVVLAAVSQVVIQLPGVGTEFRSFFHFAIEWVTPASRQVIRLFIPRAVGLAAFQVMLLITLFLVARLPQGDLGAINYAWLLIAFPVAALGTAAGTVIFPTLARANAGDDAEGIRRTVNRSLRLVIYLAVPASAALVVLRRPIVHLILPRVNEYHVEQIALALLFYALAVVPLACIEVLPRVFYALQETIAPVRIAIVTVVVDAVLSVIFVHVFPRSSAQGGLALATAIATGIQAVWLAVALNERLGGIGLRSLTLALRDTAIAAASMAVTLYVLLALLTAILPQHGIGVLVTVVLEVGVGLGVFAGISYLLGAPELWQTRGFILHRK